MGRGSALLSKTPKAKSSELLDVTEIINSGVGGLPGSPLPPPAPFQALAECVCRQVAQGLRSPTLTSDPAASLPGDVTLGKMLPFSRPVALCKAGMVI